MMIPYGKHLISEEDIQAVEEVLRSDFLTQGSVSAMFEANIAKKTGAKYSVAVNSGTSALHLACRALGIGEGDLVWTSPISFVASSNCALYCGATVDFVDIDPKTYNLSTEALAEKLKQAEKNGTLPKLLIVVHLAGQSCDMQKIAELAKKYKFYVIEDAAHAIGGKYRGQYIGCCQYSDITVFSFHPVKIITSGEGGVAVTNKLEYAQHMARLRSHGITRDPHFMTTKAHGAWFYQQLELGFNYRMTDIHAALGNSQLKRLDEFVAKRHEIAKYYETELNIDNIQLPFQSENCFSSFHLFIIRTRDTHGPLAHNELFMRLRRSGINVNFHYIPIYKHPYYKQFGFNENQFPNAEAYYKQAISLPIYPSITENELAQIVKTIKTRTGFQDLF